jgi:hypothetical protein
VQGGFGHVAEWRLSQPTEWRFSGVCLAAPAHEPHLLAVIRKPYSYDGCCPCVDGCPAFIRSTWNLERFGRVGWWPLQPEGEVVALVEGLREGWWGSGMRALPSSHCIRAMTLYLRKTTGKLSNSSRKILVGSFCGLLLLRDIRNQFVPHRERIPSSFH